MLHLTQQAGIVIIVIQEFVKFGQDKSQTTWLVSEIENQSETQM